MIKILRTHRWVKLVFLFLTLKHLKSQRLCNQLHCLHCLTMLKNKHTHTHRCRQKLKFQNCIQHTIFSKMKIRINIWQCWDCPTMIKILCTHRWVKLVLVFLTLKHLKSQRVYNHLHCLDCLTIIKNQHTHTHVDQNPNFRIIFYIQFKKIENQN